jgi:hypothetical protein
VKGEPRGKGGRAEGGKREGVPGEDGVRLGHRVVPAAIVRYLSACSRMGDMDAVCLVACICVDSAHTV